MCRRRGDPSEVAVRGCGVEASRSATVRGEHRCGPVHVPTRRSWWQGGHIPGQVTGWKCSLLSSTHEHGGRISLLLCTQRCPSANLWKKKMCLCVLVAHLCPILCDPMDLACQAPLSMEFSRQEYRRGLPFSTPGDLPDPGI